MSVNKNSVSEAEGFRFKDLVPRMAILGTISASISVIALIICYFPLVCAFSKESGYSSLCGYPDERSLDPGFYWIIGGVVGFIILSIMSIVVAYIFKKKKFFAFDWVLVAAIVIPFLVVLTKLMFQW